jgi:hypothetical protein
MSMAPLADRSFTEIRVVQLDVSDFAPGEPFTYRSTRSLLVNAFPRRGKSQGCRYQAPLGRVPGTDPMARPSPCGQVQG